MMARLGFVLARLVVATFVVLTSLYCLLAYIPFTYHQIHLGGLVAWVSTFAHIHPYLYWLALIAAGLTLPWKSGRRLKLFSALFVAVYGIAGAVLVWHPLLTRLDNNLQSLYWALLALIPLLWLAALDWAAQWRAVPWLPARSEAARMFRACLLAAIWAWLLSAALVLFRYAFTVNAPLAAGQWAAALAWSLVLHLVVFMAFFLVLNVLRAIAAMFSDRPAVPVIFYAAGAVAASALVLKYIVFTPLSFSGSWANAAALLFALSLTAFFAGTGARLYRRDDGAMETALDLLLGLLRFLKPANAAVKAALLLAASGLGIYLLARATTTDWEFLIQKVMMVAIWGATFAFFYVAIPLPRKPRGDSLVVAAALLPCLYMGYVILQPHLRLGGNAVTPDAAGFLDDYRNYDVGFRLTQELAAPPVAVAADDSLYAFLAQNTNIPRSVRTDPVEIDLTGKIAPTTGNKPNIFMIVIDSLRRDYVSAYNPDVTFTPGMQAFARESVVFQNAFTRYTGTGLSEPSIWTGALMLHKQYITPFYPMNSLQRLLEAENYRQFVARDEILKVIMKPSARVIDLEAGQATMNLEACPALSELQEKVEAAKGSADPIFAYVQPQDIHVSVINRQNRSVPGGGSYPGFEAAYASRVRRVDKCFGEFIQFLKSSGLYDSSIVILTADHGDSLGEKGRWGHAYNVVPEVARIPLIMHLPAGLQPPYVDQADPAFLTDITPTLYYLLGQRPIAQNTIFGRPLLTMTEAETSPYIRSSYLIASSYGPVYGILGNQGHSLYVADAVDYKDFFYQWKDVSDGSGKAVRADVRASGRAEIRSDVGEISRFYDFGGAARR
ncbi:MAG TPA: sulfatase-like hydrolase/transferase [Candidatus Angelobacter sp.]|nr:sulfatase-like hydrolase/transferase [Candidatus Angelobacter sp.]